MRLLQLPYAHLAARALLSKPAKPLLSTASAWACGLVLSRDDD